MEINILKFNKYNNNLVLYKDFSKYQLMETNNKILYTLIHKVI